MDEACSVTALCELLSTADHYECLGAERHASTKDLRNAFFARARVLHPDKGGNAQAFARCEEALRVLSDPRSRQVYDQLVPPASALPNHPWPTTSAHRTQVLAKAQQTSLAASCNEAEEDWGDSRPGDDIWGSTEDGERGEDQAAASSSSMITRGVVEGAMLEVLAAQGLECNPSTQLVVTCEMCFRPATRNCSACSMSVCELCTRRMHAKGAFALHWPVVAAPGSLALRIAKQETERKHLAEAAEHDKQQPGYVPPEVRALQEQYMEAAILASVHPNKLVRFDPDLAPCFMWTQTDFVVYVAVHIPTGSPDTPAVVHVEEAAAGGIVLAVGSGRRQHQSSSSAPALERGRADTCVGQLVGVPGDAGCEPDCDGSSKEGEKDAEEEEAEDGRGVDDDASDSDASSSLTSEDSSHVGDDLQQQQEERPVLAVVERRLAMRVDPDMPFEITRTGDNRFAIVALPKASPFTTWPSVFQGDAAGVRYAPVSSYPPLYRVHETGPDEAVLEIDVPTRTTPSDVTLHITPAALDLKVRSAVSLHRTFRSSLCVVPEQCTWTLLSSGESKAGRHSSSSSSSSKPRPAAEASSNGPFRRGFLGASDLACKGAPPSKVLSIVLAFAPLPQDASHNSRRGDRETRSSSSVFVEDEDSFGLTGMLQAAVFRATGQAYVTTNTTAGRWARSTKELPKDVQGFLGACD